MKKVTCKYCGTKIQAKRKSKKYCNSSCRAHASIKRKQDEIPIDLPGIRGIGGEKRNNDDQQEQDSNKSDQETLDRISQIKSQLNGKQLEKDNLEAQKKEILSNLYQRLTMKKETTCAGLMAKGIDTSIKIHNSLGSAIIGGAIGLTADMAISEITTETSKIANSNETAKLQRNYKEVSDKLALTDNEIYNLSEKLQIEQNNLAYDTHKPETVKDSEVSDIHKDPTGKRLDSANSDSIKHHGVAINNITCNTDKIKNSYKLKDKKYNDFAFKGEWEYFLGKPEKGFSMAIHGLPGHGKSSFAIKISKYLAENFGRCLYVAAEEGHSKTINDKLARNNSYHSNLDIGDMKTREEFFNIVKPGSYDFIIFDSLNTMGMENYNVKDIMESFTDTSFIFICQSTKDGKIRGSQKIVHDCNIVIEIDNKVARTIKNRFQDTPREFRVFSGKNGHIDHSRPEQVDHPLSLIT